MQRFLSCGSIDYLQWAFAVFGLIAAGFWVAAARVKLPPSLSVTFGGLEPGLRDLHQALRRQARFNAWAAAAGAIAALLGVLLAANPACPVLG